LTNVRYAADLLVYAKSFPELVYMIESLCEELALVGVQLYKRYQDDFFTLCTENLSMAARWVCFPMLLTSIWEEYMQVI
jgi:hypothetical protein